MKLWGSLSELVSLIFRKDSQQITVRPNQSTTYTGARDIQLPPGDAAHVLTSASSTQTLTNKSIDADTNTITNIENADIKSGAAIDASKIADGSVSSTEFQYIGGLTSDAQTQLNAKLDDFSSSNDNRLVRTNGTAGDAVQESAATLSDAGALSGLTQLTVDNVDVNGNTVSSTSGDLNLNAGANVVNLEGANVFIRGGADLSFYDNDNSNAITISVPADVTSNRTPQIPDDTGNFTLTTATQTLTNKTLTAPTLDDYFDVNEETAPGTPASGKVRVYAKSDKKLYTKDSSGVEQEIGSGSASGNVSFFFDDLENGSASNWTGYADAAAATPVDGTGGTATTLTVTASSSSPLREVFSLSVAKSASNGQGQGIAAAVTIPSGYQQAAKRVIEFLWDGSGANYVAGDMACYVYDVTNSLLITPSVTALPAAKVPIQISWDSSSSASYRLIFHVATTNASAYTVKLDDITVGPGTIISAAPVGPTTTYVPTITGFGTPTGVVATYNQTANKIKVSIKFTAGTVTAVPASFSLPNSWTTNDGSNAGAARIVGRWARNSSTAAQVKEGPVIVPNTANSTVVNLSYADTAAAAAFTTVQNADNIIGTGQLVELDFEVSVNELAGAPNYAGQNDVEYASNSSAFDTTDTTSFAYGPNGAAGINTALTANRNKTVRFLTPIQATDELTLEYLSAANTWIAQENSNSPFTATASQGFGATLVPNANGTDVLVQFYQNAVAGTTFNSQTGALGWNVAQPGTRWRVKKARAGAAVGFGAATNDRMGLVSREYAENWSTSLTTNGTGPGTTSTISIRLQRIGNFVTAYIPDFTATAGSGSPDRFTVNTAMPSWARPLATTNINNGTVRNNAASSGDIALWQIPATGVMVMYRNNSGSLFTASTSCGIQAPTVLTWYIGT